MRHPIYTALLSLYAGTAIVSGELHALIGLALVIFAYLRKIRLEEANLLKAFSADYRRVASVSTPQKPHRGCPRSLALGDRGTPDLN